jgi:S1-C subfamily serine protease
VAERYWEAYDTAEGRRYIAFAQVAMPRDNLARLAAAYKQDQTALGATVVDFQPELGWRFPRLDHGAVVTKLEHGVLQELGLAERYIVLAVDGHDVADAATFAKLVASERDILVERGGSLRLLVQTDTGDPREFATTFAGKPATVPTPPTPHGRHGTDERGSAGVNVWDRFGGNRGSGRDDPTQ